MPQVSTSTSSSATLSEMRRGQVQNEALARREERRERVLARVDRLVRGMEAVAQRLSSDKVSTSQRSVLVSRFNELQRRVNEIDGVVGSEGRGDAVSGAAAPRLELKVDSSDKANFRERLDSHSPHSYSYVDCVRRDRNPGNIMQPSLAAETHRTTSSRRRHVLFIYQWSFLAY